MTKFQQEIDNIFEAILGEKNMKNEYEFEAIKMEEFVCEYVNCMEIIKHIPTPSELARIICFAQYMIIGNEKCHNINKLKQVSIDIWNSFYS